MCIFKKAGAEALGTFVLVFVACGTAITASMMGWVDTVATALAFGLVIVAMAYTIGNISGCHINPAVSLGVLVQQKMAKKKEFGFKEFGVYVAAQFIGAIAGAAALFGIMQGIGAHGFIDYAIFATNSVPATTGGFIGGFAAEVILTFIFVLVILTVVNNVKTQKKAGFIIGLTLTLVHLVGIGITGTSVNPARSFGPALMQLAFGGGSVPLQQIWVFILAPLVGAFLAALVHKCFQGEKKSGGEPEMANVEQAE